jgi:hypothetical protein
MRFFGPGSDPLPQLRIGKGLRVSLYLQQLPLQVKSRLSQPTVECAEYRWTPVAATDRRTGVAGVSWEAAP